MGVSLIGHNSSNPRIGQLHLTHSIKASHSKWGYKLSLVSDIFLYSINNNC